VDANKSWPRPLRTPSEPAGCGASKPAPSAHGSGAAAIDRWMDDKWMDSCHKTKIFFILSYHKKNIVQLSDLIVQLSDLSYPNQTNPI
jgi:hypothetical protein